MILGVKATAAGPMPETHIIAALTSALSPVPQPQNVVLRVLRDGETDLRSRSGWPRDQIKPRRGTIRSLPSKVSALTLHAITGMKTFNR